MRKKSWWKTLQALMTIITPLIILLMLIVQNKKSVMGDHTPSRAINVAMVLIFLFSIDH